jgi:defect-in-organelle-trafficking protein DotA
MKLRNYDLNQLNVVFYQALLRVIKVLFNATKFILPIVIALLPSLIHAADSIASDSSSLNFKPPPGDVSILFLGNIFGVVDGVLAGTGSQIVGQMFGVFNSAVLALGGILITYTLLVSTLNTAQEGQFLGQRWNSVWVPLRSIGGVVLLLPKASGYCLMQIFVMWIVVQGVGAADKIWAQALSYLNRGGAIVRPNVDPVTLMTRGKDDEIANGAYGILAAQVCMLGLEQMTTDYHSYVVNNNTAGTLCNKPASQSVIDFCRTSVPDFLNSVNLVGPTNPGDTNSESILQSSSSSVSMPMPNFGIEPYRALNGACGHIQFKQLELPGRSRQSVMQSSGSDTTGNPGDALSVLTSSELKTLSNSRAIAMNQLYISLERTAQKIMQNAPKFNQYIDCKSDTPCVDPETAQFHYGVPLTLQLAKCKATANPYNNYNSKTNSFRADEGGGYRSDACLSWDLIGGATEEVLLRGNELKDALAAYNGMMSASLFIVSQSENSADYNKQRAFIRKSENQGWLLAGAYYFRLAILTSQVLQQTSDSNAVDQNSGLKICSPADVDAQRMACGRGQWSTNDMLNYFKDCSHWGGNKVYKALFCTDSSFRSDITTKSERKMFGNNLDALANLIKGKASQTPKVPSIQGAALEQPIYGPATNSSYKEPDSVYGYLINGAALVTPGQPGARVPQFSFQITYNPSTNVPKLGKQNIRGGFWDIPGQVMTAIWNDLIVHLFNWMLSLLLPLLNMLFFAFLNPPMMLMTSVFFTAMDVMKNPSVNPILALANMGVGFIEGVANSWILMIMSAISALMLGLPGMGLMLILLPVVTGWLGVMFGIGVTCLYYVPLTPFLVFLFASIGWFMGVIEAMVAAPVVALGVMHPEGNDAFGKGDQAIMLLLGTFLRPPMMILGYIFGIILSYVGIWFINAGFEIVIPQIETLPKINTDSTFGWADGSPLDQAWSTAAGAISGNVSIYGMWSTIFLIVFEMIIYTTTLVVVVNKSFELIHYLPDKVLRWIGGGQESLGEGAQKGLQDVKKAHESASAQTGAAVMKVNQALQDKVTGWVKDKLSQDKSDKQDQDQDQSEDDSAEGDAEPEVSGEGGAGGGAAPPAVK